LGAVVALVLTGCTPASNVYAKRDGDFVMFLSCEPDFQVNQIRVSFFSTSSHGTTVWQVDGSDLMVGFGEEYRVGEILPGFTTTIQYSTTVDELGDGAFEVAFNYLDVDGAIENNEVASFRAPRLSESAWIDSNGRTVDQPC
jgi:hypothetical protein